MPPLWGPNYTFNCVLDKGASSGGGAGKIRNEELGIRNEGGGAQIGKRRLMIHDSGFAAPFDTTHPPVGRAPRGRRLGVQKRRQLGPGSAVLCRTAAFRAVGAC